MQINRINPGVSVQHQTPSFEAIHPTRYFFKCEDGQFRQVTNADTIRLLQGKIVKMLNKAMNEARRAAEGKAVRVNKSETSTEKSIRERLINFMINNDRDYAQRRAVKSVYVSGAQGELMRPYILTGHTVDLGGDGKSIGKIHGKIRETRDFVRSYYGLSDTQASTYVSAADARRLSEAKADYHNQSAQCVRNLMADKRVDKAPIDFYFEPQLTPKSKKVSKFNLVNAILKRFLIDPQA
ncbi:MAG: hypothetical protein NC191_06015 [Muribaculaceae bacterium]|nr:hypothetical protein [Muribaculaceae bacterium]